MRLANRRHSCHGGWAAEKPPFRKSRHPADHSAGHALDFGAGGVLHSAGGFKNHGGRKRWDRETKFVRGGGVGHDARRENRRFTGGARWNPMSPSDFELGRAWRSARCGQRAQPMLRGAGRLGCEGSASDAFQSRAVARDRRRRQDHVERIAGFLDGEFLQRLVIELHVDPL